MDYVGFEESSRKRVKTTDVTSNDNDFQVDPTPLTDRSDVAMLGQDEKQEAKVKREEIDAWFMQEFGQYVEFT